jgi:Synergist-CTERM protein sorting domain-containing protein
MGVVELTIAAPMVNEETPIFTQFQLENGGQSFGTINIAVTVTPNGDEDTSSEADDANDDGAVVTGGCNAGGSGSAWLALGIPALLIARRRRRR